MCSSWWLNLTMVWVLSLRCSIPGLALYFYFKLRDFTWWGIVKYSVFFNKLVLNEFNYNLFQKKWQNYVVSHTKRQSPSVGVFTKTVWREEGKFRLLTDNTRHLHDWKLQILHPSRKIQFCLKGKNPCVLKFHPTVLRVNSSSVEASAGLPQRQFFSMLCCSVNHFMADVSMNSWELGWRHWDDSLGMLGLLWQSPKWTTESKIAPKLHRSCERCLRPTEVDSINAGFRTTTAKSSL